MKKKILIIEDESALLYALKAELSYNGYEVDSALNGEEGLDKIKNNSPDLVILDLILPKMNGLQILEEVKANPKTKEIPVMIVSNLSDKDKVEKCLKLGAVGYLIKTDYSLEKILEKIHKVLK